MLIGIRVWRDTEGWGTRKTYRHHQSRGSNEMTGGSVWEAALSIVVPNAWHVWRYKRERAALEEGKP